MLSTQEVNTILIKYKPLIDNAIIKIGVDYRLLDNRCITLDDLKQEVYIKLWERLENYYDPKYDLERFLSFHASFHAKFIISNLRRSSSCLIGSLDPYRKSGQAKIDNHKVYFSKIMEAFVNFPTENYNQDFLNYHNNVPFLGHNTLVDNSYLIMGESIDYSYIIAEIKYRLLEQTKVNKKYNQIYADIFDFIIDNYNLLHDKTTLQLIIAEKFNYKTRGGVRYILNKIKQIMYEVITEYVQD